MLTHLLTILLAFAVFGGALALFGIGWLLTGKSRLQPGACGRAPHQKRNEGECGTKTSCSLCEKD